MYWSVRAAAELASNFVSELLMHLAQGSDEALARLMLHIAPYAPQKNCEDCPRLQGDALHILQGDMYQTAEGILRRVDQQQVCTTIHAPVNSSNLSLRHMVLEGIMAPTMLRLPLLTVMCAASIQRLCVQERGTCMKTAV